MSLVEVERHGDVAHVVLSDPPLNRFSMDLARDLSTAVAEVSSSDARAVLLRAEGEHFSAGADVNMFIGLSEEEARGGLDEFMEMVHQLERLEIPTLAAVQGACVAAGLEVALGCDLIWAADEAQMGQLEAMIGATPFAGGSQRLVARAGAGRAKEMVMTGGLYPAQKMLEWGVVQRVVPTADLREKAERFAARLAAGPTRAHAVTKQVMRAHLEGGLEQADAILPALGATVMVTEDLQNGVKTFLEQGPGKAEFNGR